MLLRSEKVTWRLLAKMHNYFVHRSMYTLFQVTASFEEYTGGFPGLFASPAPAPLWVNLVGRFFLPLQTVF